MHKINCTESATMWSSPRGSRANKTSIRECKLLDKNGIKLQRCLSVSSNAHFELLATRVASLIA
jgi:hypothetical protein